MLLTNLLHYNCKSKMRQISDNKLTIQNKKIFRDDLKHIILKMFVNLSVEY